MIRSGICSNEPCLVQAQEGQCLCERNITIRCRRSVSAVSVGGQCRRSVSAVSVGGQCRRSVSTVSVYATYATCATYATFAGDEAPLTVSVYATPFMGEGFGVRAKARPT